MSIASILGFPLHYLPGLLLLQWKKILLKQNPSSSEISALIKNKLSNIDLTEFKSMNFVQHIVAINQCMRTSCKERNYQHFNNTTIASHCNLIMYKATKWSTAPLHSALICCYLFSIIIFKNLDCAIPRCWTVAYGKHSLTLIFRPCH